MVKPRPLHRKNGVLLGEMARKGYTIRNLAKAIGVHYLTVWRIVNRESRPTVETARKIAEVLGRSTRQLGLETWGKAKDDSSQADQEAG